MTVPPSTAFDPRFRRGVLILLLSVLTAFGPLSIDMYLPALPTIAADLGVVPARAQLTLSAFFLGFGGGQLIYGPLSDRFGRRAPLLAALVLFALASLGCALARDLNTLIACRFVQALGGCAGPVIARAVVRDLYERDRAARVLSLMVLVMGVAPVLAPILGAQILLHAGWRAIFAVLVGFAVLIFVATLALLPETLPFERRARGGVATLILGYGAPLKHRRFLGYALSSACVYGGLFAYITGSPLVLITLYGISPQRFALIFATNVLGILVTAAINGRIVMRFGIDRLLAFGVLAAAISGTLLGLSALSGWGGLIALLVPLFFFLATIGFVGANAVAGCLSLFPTRAGSASALVGTLQFLTGALASALLGAISGTSALPMAGSIALAGILSLVIQRTLARA